MSKLSQTVGYYVAFGAQGLVVAAIGPTLPGLAAQTQTALSAIGVLFTARALGSMAGAFLGGRLYDRLLGHPVMAGALLLMAALLALVPLCAELWPLALIVGLLGAAIGIMNLGGNMLLVWVHRERAGPYMNGLHLCFGIGALLSPLIVAQVIAYTGEIVLVYWVLAVLMVPVALWLLCLPSPAAETAGSARPAEPVNYRLAGLAVLFFFVYMGGEISFGSWLFTYAVTARLHEPVLAAYLTALFGGALTLGRLLAIPMAGRLRPRTILAFDLAAGLVGAGILLLWPASVTALWVGTAWIGVALASVFPTALSFVQRRMPVTGRVTSWFMIAGGAGAMSFPWLIGQLMGRYGPLAMPVAILVNLAAALAVFGVLLFFWSRPTHRVYQET